MTTVYLLGENPIRQGFLGRRWIPGLLAFLFLLSTLGMMGFPISPTFLGVDLLFSHIHEDQFLLAFFAALAFVMEGIAAVRIFARLFLGSKKALPLPVVPLPRTLGGIGYANGKSKKSIFKKF